MKRGLPWIVCGALVLVAGYALRAHAARVAVTPAPAGAAGTVISGVWPNACTPTITGRSGDDVLLSSSGNLCGAQPHAFSLTLPPPVPFSPAPPGDRVRPLRVFAARDASAPAHLVGFRLLGGRDRPIHPDAGFWWPRDTRTNNGSVLSIDLQDDAIGVGLMSYDANGAPTWYFGTGHLTGSVAHVSLLRMAHGSSPFAPRQISPQARPSMSIDLAFSSDTRARAWLSQPDTAGGMDLVAMTIARVPFSDQPPQQRWLGTWLVASQPDAGQPALPASLDWTTSQALDASHRRLVDAGGDYALDCLHGNDDDHATAQRCVLRDAGGNVIAQFDDVGFDRLDGHTSDGQPIVLVRPR